jgi:hypothetical protein
MSLEIRMAKAKTKSESILEDVKDFIEDAEAKAEEIAKDVAIGSISVTEKVVDAIDTVIDKLDSTLKMIVASKGTKLKNYTLDVSETVYGIVTKQGWMRSTESVSLNQTDIDTIANIKYLFKNGHTSFKVRLGEMVTLVRQ